MMTEDAPLPGAILSNEEISTRFKVGVMGGMRRSTRLNLLVLISDPFKGLYQDRWDDGILNYTGMGPSGHQDLNYSQNRTLSESISTEIPVHLMEALEPQKYTYVGKVELVGAPYQEEQPDDHGNSRLCWMFPLQLLSGNVPPLSVAQASGIELAHSRIAKKLPLDALKARAAQANEKPATRVAHTTVFVRDAAVTELAKRLAQGRCDLCSNEAPFLKRSSEPYLECHHIIWLAEGGKDRIENTVALCPNCHRKMHVLNATSDRKILTARVGARS